MKLGSTCLSSSPLPPSSCHCVNCQYPPPRSLSDFRCVLQWSPVEENGFASSVDEHNQVNGFINMQEDDNGGKGLYGEAAAYMHERRNPPLGTDGRGYSMNIVCTNANSTFKNKVIFSTYLSFQETEKLLRTEGNVLVIRGGCISFHKQRPLLLSVQVQRQQPKGKCTIMNARLHLTEEDFAEFCQTIK